jgi:hypothetical protein
MGEKTFEKENRVDDIDHISKKIQPGISPVWWNLRSKRPHVQTFFAARSLSASGIIWILEDMISISAANGNDPGYYALGR